MVSTRGQGGCVYRHYHQGGKARNAHCQRHQPLAGLWSRSQLEDARFYSLQHPPWWLWLQELTSLIGICLRINIVRQSECIFVEHLVKYSSKDAWMCYDGKRQMCA